MGKNAFTAAYNRLLSEQLSREARQAAPERFQRETYEILELHILRWLKQARPIDGYPEENPDFDFMENLCRYSSLVNKTIPELMARYEQYTSRDLHRFYSRIILLLLTYALDFLGLLLALHPERFSAAAALVGSFWMLYTPVLIVLSVWAMGQFQAAYRMSFTCKNSHYRDELLADIRKKVPTAAAFCSLCMHWCEASGRHIPEALHVMQEQTDALLDFSEANAKNAPLTPLSYYHHVDYRIYPASDEVDLVPMRCGLKLLEVMDLTENLLVRFPKGPLESPEDLDFLPEYCSDMDADLFRAPRRGGMLFRFCHPMENSEDLLPLLDIETELTGVIALISPEKFKDVQNNWGLSAEAIIKHDLAKMVFTIDHNQVLHLYFHPRIYDSTTMKKILRTWEAELPPIIGSPHIERTVTIKARGADYTVDLIPYDQ